MKNRYEPSDLDIFERWIDAYISNWAACDEFCKHSVGGLIGRFPGKVVELDRWARSGNLWLRRAAAVSLVVPARDGMFLSDIFRIADILCEDREEMVRKGFGWLLKEASRIHQDEVLSYVMRKRRTMPRTSLRYAIELMPSDLKAEAMRKDW